MIRSSALWDIGDTPPGTEVKNNILFTVRRRWKVYVCVCVYLYVDICIYLYITFSLSVAVGAFLWLTLFEFQHFYRYFHR